MKTMKKTNEEEEKNKHEKPLKNNGKPWKSIPLRISSRKSRDPCTKIRGHYLGLFFSFPFSPKKWYMIKWSKKQKIQAFSKDNFSTRFAKPRVIVWQLSRLC